MLHVTRIAEFGRSRLRRIFETADRFRLESPDALRSRHAGRIVATLFYEPSTRTRLSFESAAMRLGAQCIGFSDPKAASVAKGETLIDTVRTVQRYCDAIVLRHPAEGAPLLASKVATVPIINAGDGGHEHPTQTLFDLYTAHQRFGSLESRAIGMIGDLRFGRTAHSLAQAAALFGVTLYCIAPDELQMPEHLVADLRDRTTVRLERELNDVLPELDVLYVTRVQAERMPAELMAKIGVSRVISAEALPGAKAELMVMHPLPRVDEISPAFDSDPRAWYFEQLANGVPIRMALLDEVLSASRANPLGASSTPHVPSDPPWLAVEAHEKRCCNPQCVTTLEKHVAPRWERDRCAYCDHLTR
ncbi:MAG TPA: aspartate carbamoyltransferase [Phycisphaerales bacterium]|nr:aspartate carbamoyltransferase [Phycisphaerales bacterium]